MPARHAPGRAVDGNPKARHRLTALAATICPLRDPSVTPKTPPWTSRSLGPSHSISIGDGAVGPPRNGFVLRLCIRKPDGA